MQQILFENPSVTISKHEAEQWLYVNWIGSQNAETVSLGGQNLAYWLAQTKLKKVLNDNRGILDMWTGVGDWGKPENFSLLAQAGCRYFAVIASPNSFNRISSEEIARQAVDVTVRTFETYHQAADWLREMPAD